MKLYSELCNSPQIYYAVLSQQIAYLFKHATTLADFYDVLPTLAGANICLMKVIALFYKLNKVRA